MAGLPESPLAAPPPRATLMYSTTGIASRMSIARSLLAVSGVSLESVAFTVKLKTPTCVGVPVMAPVVPLSARPGGSEPAEMLQVSSGMPPVPLSTAL